VGEHRDPRAGVEQFGQRVDVGPQASVVGQRVVLRERTVDVDPYTDRSVGRREVVEGPYRHVRKGSLAACICVTVSEVVRVELTNGSSQLNRPGGSDGATLDAEELAVDRDEFAREPPQLSQTPCSA